MKRPAAASAGPSTSSGSKKRKSLDAAPPAAHKKPKTATTSSDAARPSAAASVLLAAGSQTDFPRGGGSVLTPLEHRTALREARAEADALFRDSSTLKAKAKGKAAGTADAAAAAADEQRNKAGLARQKHNRDKRNALKKKQALPSAAADDAGQKKREFGRIEHLNYKRLQTGARLLCTVLAVHPFALVLSLPGQLLGHVPITAISPAFTERLQSIADAADDDSESDNDSEGEVDDEDEDHSSDEDQDGDAYPANGTRRKSSKRPSEVPELREMYTVGQWVHATVTKVLSTGELKAANQSKNSSTRSREGGEYERESRRVQLSLDPTEFNAGVAADELGPGFLLPVSIKSVEDHGYLLALGFDPNVSGFCAFKDAPGGKKGPRLQVGQVVPAAVLTVADTRRSVTLSLQTKDVHAAFLGSKATPPSLSGLLPGLAVDALITANVPAGLNVKLFGLFDATIEREHLPPLPKAQTYENFFKEGKKIRARVFWELGDLHAQRLALGEGDGGEEGGAGQYRKIALSAAEHVLALDPPGVAITGGLDPSAPRRPLPEAFPIGTKLKVTVTRVDADWGLFCTLAGSDAQRAIMGPDAASLPGFVHISAVADKHLDTLSLADSAPYRAGSTHEARVISHAPTDRLLMLSLKPSVLALKFMRVSEVAVGEILRGSVLEADEKKIVVDLGGAHSGVVFPAHFSDIQLKSKKALAKYKPGLSVSVRVWAVQPGKNRIALTLKKSLLHSDLPVVGSLQDARVGVVTHAIVSRLPDPAASRARGGAGGLLVDLYGGLRAFVPASETSDGSGGEVPSAAELNTRFFHGKVVKVRLTAVDYDSGRLIASVRQALPAFQERLNVSQYAIGQKVEATVAAVHEDIVVLNVAPTRARGLVALSVLARMRGIADVEALRAELGEGDAVSGLAVWSKNEEKGLLHLNDARAAANGRGPSGGAGVDGSSRAGRSAADEAAAKALVIASQTYKAVVKAHSVRGEHNTAQVLLTNLDASGSSSSSRSTTLLAQLHVTDCYDSFDAAAGEDAASCVQGAPRGEGSRAAVNLPAEGAELNCVVLEVDTASTGHTRRIYLSARPSVLASAGSGRAAAPVRDPVVNEVADLVVGSTYRGFVRAIGDGGLTVDLGRAVQARVKVREAVDVLTSAWKEEFEIGKVVEGRVKSINKGTKTVVDMTLRTPPEERTKQRAAEKAAKDKTKKANGTVTARLPAQHGLDRFEKGQKVKCFVKNIKDDVGLFLQIEQAESNVSGLCHKSEIADNGAPEAVRAYSIGDRVKAIILKINEETKKISFGLKPSYFTDADFADSEEEEEDVEMAGEEEESDDDEDEDEDDDEEEDGADADARAEAFLAASELLGDDSDEDDDVEMDGADDDDDEDEDEDDDAIDMGSAAVSTAKTTDKAESSKVVPLTLAGGFSWSAAADNDADADSDDDDDSDASSEVDKAEARKAKAKANGKAKAAAAKKTDPDEKLPESASDFERLLLGSPNNSFLWIQFMSLQLQLSDVEGARAVARRALNVISYREEREKLNVWIALLNLEDQYGTPETLDAAFKEAVRANDAETVYMRMVAILEKSGKRALAETHWNRAVKKFNGSVPVWAGFARFLLRQQSGRAGTGAGDVRALMGRAQQSLPKHRHVELVSAFALAEFAEGEPERGRTLFERLVDAHPKKLDLWLQYIDQETKVDTAAARAIYERVLIQPLSVKKAKSVLRKWHAFEEKHGSAADVQRVIRKAQDFVEATQRKRSGGVGPAAAAASADGADELDDDLVEDEDDE